MGEYKIEQERELSTKELIHDTLTDELIIGICAPIGTDKTDVINSLIEQLTDTYDYDVRKIKLSEDFIKKYGGKFDVKSASSGTSAYQQMDKLINQGDKLRGLYEHGILVELAIDQIRREREEEVDSSKKNFQYTTRRVCYIIDSLKNQDELNLLRSVYRENFYFFGIFSTLRDRQQHLLSKNLANDEIDILIGKDNSTGVKYGQEVQKIFQKSDFFIRYEKPENNIEAEKDAKTKLTNHIQRYLHLIFDSSVITPTFHETAMYQAAAASRNSACLSRQVGACITDSDGEIISIGWNDVPKFGGGLYQTNLNNGNADNRCAYWDSEEQKICHNDKNKNLLASEIIDSLVKNEIIKPMNKSRAVDLIRKDSGISQIIEFSRAVHAEMQAIIIGSQQSGRKMRDGKLYTTTYPCHNCARHIIAAGIREVYYIEPYAKSLSTVLHSDAITESEKSNSDQKVKILIFDGVSPNRYLEFFSIHSKRKADGVYLQPLSSKLKKVSPVSRMSLNDIPALEAKIVKRLTKKEIFDS